MIQKLTGPKGFTYAQINGLRLHSPYDPQREADRFIREKVRSAPSKILLLGPGLGYLIRSCRSFFPGLSIIAVYYHDEFFKEADTDLTDATCFTGPAELEIFLLSKLNELDIDSLAVVEWPASARTSPDTSILVNKTVKSVIQRLYGNFMTTDSFGSKMLMNSFKNFIFHHRIFDLQNLDSPVVIAASGPSLEKALPYLKEKRSAYILLALPSSVEPLRCGGILPDAVIISDAGFYAGCHSASIYRYLPESTLIIKTMISSFSKELVSNPTMFIGWEDIFEEPFLALYYGTANRIPENGTVAGTALEFALRWRCNSIFFTGLDLSYSDLLSHSRPHPFYRMFLSRNNRCNPFQSGLFSRRKLFEESSSAFPLYASWFSLRLQSSPVPVYRIDPSPVHIQGITDINGVEFHRFLSNSGKNKTADISLSTCKSAALPQRIELCLSLISGLEDSLQQLRSEYGSGSRTEIDLTGPGWKFLYTLNPIKLKLYIKARREKDSDRQNLLAGLFTEGEKFLRCLSAWVSSL